MEVVFDYGFFCGLGDEVLFEDRASFSFRGISLLCELESPLLLELIRLSLGGVHFRRISAVGQLRRLQCDWSLRTVRAGPRRQWLEGACKMGSRGGGLVYCYLKRDTARDIV